MNKLSMLMISVLIGSLSLTGCADMFVRRTPAASPDLIKNLSEKKNVQVVQRGDTVKIILATDGCFDLYTTTILYSCRSALNATANVLNSYSNVPITVAGYTDQIVPPLNAKILSKRQAESVVAYLWANSGVAYQRFNTVGYGAEYPIATNLNPDDSAYNRRVEITLRRA